ncbi:hypothetical protein [Ammoniphilus sp. CFH 90114]|uniref:hypothetical protein n=1 Tax=Ammoniphilus sp. CFH 90114 TaxID=2493665 RepID=UPI00100E099F|nr:hypothetical protein [Ammoniphilus sp. CFH 90114]RXT04498.1 hypothetical protein EIZ39_19960 [Ammoniphilus sp. CFH 90114]
MHLKRYKQLGLGMILGGTVATTGTAFADSSVWVKMLEAVKIKVNEVEKNTSKDTVFFYYNNELYAPIRLVAESLEGKAEYDKDKNLLNLETIKTDTHLPLPLSQVTSNGVVVTIKSSMISKDQLFLDVRVSNGSDVPINLAAGEAILVADNEQIKADLSGPNLSWVTTIAKDDSKENHIMFSDFPEDAQDFTLFLKVRNNDGVYKTYDLKYYIELSKREIY